MDAILLISKYPAIAEKWQSALALNYKITLASEALSDAFRPHALIILDSHFIDQQPFLISQIKQAAIKLLIVGEQWPEDNQVDALAAGAAGYCDANVPNFIILKAIESILQNEIWIQRHLIHKVLATLVNSTTSLQPALVDAKLANLSKRERAVAQLIGEGTSNKAIAARLFISERTVKAHLTSIFSKLKITNRLHLGLLFKKTGN
ncbi:MAG: response regulator transcription factor [Methylococcaceae bacterium]|nr:response regulator transcription factor [Methylococcaceae bacterium]